MTIECWDKTAKVEHGVVPMALELPRRRYD